MTPVTSPTHRKPSHGKSGGKDSRHVGTATELASGTDLHAHAEGVEFGRMAVHDPRHDDDGPSAGTLAAEPRQDGVGAVAGIDTPDETVDAEVGLMGGTPMEANSVAAIR